MFKLVSIVKITKRSLGLWRYDSLRLRIHKILRIRKTSHFTCIYFYNNNKACVFNHNNLNQECETHFRISKIGIGCAVWAF